MARANLQVSKELHDQFNQAHGNPQNKTRWIKVRVDDVTMVPLSSGASSGDIAKDLAHIRSNVLDKDASFIIVCIDPDANPRQWILIAHVPQTCKVTSRMLYASGRDDLKTALGVALFKGEVHCTDVEDLTVEAFLRPVNKATDTDLPWTEAEKMIKEEHAASARPSGKTEKGMASVEFAVTDNLVKKLKSFVNGEVNWIECKITDDEKIDALSAEKIDPSSKNLASKIHKNEPRFYLLHRVPTTSGLDPRNYLVFSCPETAAIRLRMVYSTCKSALFEQAIQNGVTIDKMLEVRSEEEIDFQLSNAETVDDSAGKIVHQVVDRPRGPPSRTKKT